MVFQRINGPGQRDGIPKQAMARGAARGHSRKCRSLTSSRIRRVQTQVHQVAGVTRSLHELAGPTKIAERSARALTEMTVTERHALEALRAPALNNATDGHVGGDYESDGYGEMV